MKLIVDVLEQLAGLQRGYKRLIVVLIDVICCALSIIVAFALRTDTIVYWNHIIGPMMAVGIPLSIAVFAVTGVYRSVFRFAGLGMMRTLMRSFAVYTILLMSIFTLLWYFSDIRVNRSLLFLHPLFYFGFVMAARMIARYLLADVLGRSKYRGRRQSVLIYGAGNAGQKLAVSLLKEPGMVVVGFIDDDARLDGQRLDGLRVYHSSKIAGLIDSYAVTDILLAIVSLSRFERQQLVAQLANFPVHVRVLPGIKDLAEGRVSFSDIREVEIDDLLGREPVRPNELLLGRTIVGKSVLVSGAGGSIGSELCRKIVTVGASRLILLEINEFALYSIHKELLRIRAEVGASTEIVPLLGSVQDRARMEYVFEYYRPDTVYHAAAYKHVPLVEANPVEAVGNNIFGTLQIVTSAQAVGVRDFILVSTDKAVRPTNVMGATKRCAELILQAHAEESTTTKFSMVRFGNVLGSSGSVVPLFRQQIAAGGPVTLTHEAVTRYFMTIPEAAELVIQAAGLAQGGEVFLLDMGQPIKISELARKMIRLSGLSERTAEMPDGDIEVTEIGLRPGEKLYEELLIGDASAETQHPRIFKANEDHMQWDVLKHELDLLRPCRDRADALNILYRLVPEFQHNLMTDNHQGEALPRAEAEG